MGVVNIKQGVLLGNEYLEHDTEYSVQRLTQLFETHKKNSKYQEATYFKTSVEVNWDGDDTEVDFIMHLYRMETDEELVDRLVQEEIAARKKKENEELKRKRLEQKKEMEASPEYQQYLALKAKFSL